MSKCHTGNIIRVLRFHAGEMTQQELADKTGVTRQTLIAFEQGKYSPSPELEFRISRVFNSPVNEVFYYSHDTEKAVGDIRN